jgi:hypothetical protein
MATWGIGIFAVSLILYFVTRKKLIFLFISGVGMGLFIGGIWAMYVVYSAIPW